MHHVRRRAVTSARSAIRTTALRSPARSIGARQHGTATAGASSFSKLLFAQHSNAESSTRPLLPDPVLNIPTTVVSTPGVVKVYLDSTAYELPTTFLRDSCRCAKCVDSGTSQKTFNTGDIPPSLAVSALRVVNNSLEVVWDDADGHRSIYPSKQLAACVDATGADRARYDDVASVPWTRDAITALRDAGSLGVRYEQYTKSDAAVHATVSNLARYGLSFISGCPSGPENSGVLADMAQRIGPLKNTFYGSTWDVRSIADARNVAYTSVDLDLHMDLLYFESPPGLQFLHCLQNDVQGGSSVFVDSFAAARQLYAADADAFHALAGYDVGYHYDNDGQHYFQKRPTFVLRDPALYSQLRAHRDPSSLSEAEIERATALRYVNYSPPFQSPQLPAGFAEYQRAVALYAGLLADESNRLELTLGPGDCVVFDNRRTLHARRAFHGPGARWLKGAYCDVDALWSKWRVGERQRRS